MYSLGKKVKLLRKEIGLKQEELTCNILSRTMLSKIENDKVTPSIYQLDHIAKKLGVSIEFFLQTYSLPYDNNEKFKDSLYKLFENENFDLHLFREQAKKYIKRFSWENTALQYVELYKSLL